MRIGIVGGGQLGLMLGMAARELGIDCLFLDPATDPPAARVGEVMHAGFDDADALADLFRRCDVVTYEFENLDVDAIRRATGGKPVQPAVTALQTAQDRLLEKRLFAELDIPLPRYATVDSLADLEQAAAGIGLPLVLKTRRFGYDGKGQRLIRAPRGMADACAQLGPDGLIAEQCVVFDSEVSAIGVRFADGDFRAYALTENRHVDGILAESRAPVDDRHLTATANDYLRRIMDHFDYVGVLALELFVVGDGLLANEFAPRVHNSGHWTLDGAVTSQFASHILAVAGRPPGDTACLGHAGMLNLIGVLPAAAHGLEPAAGRLHDYGKTPRPGRKLAHINVLAETAPDRDRKLARLVDIVI